MWTDPILVSGAIIIGAFVISVVLLFAYMIYECRRPHPPRKIRKSLLDKNGNVIGYIEEDEPARQQPFFFWWR